MAYDEALAARVRRALGGRRDVEEKKMFGGLAFMLAGHMCCGLQKSDLILRLGKEGAAAALRDPATRYFDFTGKPMKTMVVVAAEAIADDSGLKSWLDRAVAFAGTLPPK